MGLTAWKNSPHGRIRKEDVAVAKNYLDEQELNALHRIVTMYLDYAELQATNRAVLHMKAWIRKLDAFLRFNERDILDNPVKVSTEIAKAFTAALMDWLEGEIRVSPELFFLNY